MRSLPCFSLALSLALLTGCGSSSDGGFVAPAGPSDPDAKPAPDGALTAGVLDDNLDFGLYAEYVAAHEPSLPGAPPLAEADREASRALFEGGHGPRTTLDVALVVDTTGSMADELQYLTQEFGAIASAIEAAHPDVEVRWATIAYRDHGDSYVTDTRDFGDAAQAQAHLSDMSADGGGDWPEAVCDALDDALGLSWEAEGRLVFWIADAPHHDGEAQRFADAVMDARDQALRLYPIAASGVDALAELSMRSAAQMTGGRYLFLTDDSGIGNAHADPTAVCYFVTTLADAVTRMVSIEVSGAYVAPDPADILRSVGAPEAGVCSLDGGVTAHAY